MKEEIIIRQQIALNNSMYESQNISKQLHGHTHKVLLARLTKTISDDKIIE